MQIGPCEVCRESILERASEKQLVTTFDWPSPESFLMNRLADLNYGFLQEIHLDGTIGDPTTTNCPPPQE